MSVLELARPSVRVLTPYASARMESSHGAVMLNANESPWPSGPGGLNRYPDPQPLALRKRLADLYGVDADQVLIGRGSDEAIDLLIRAFCVPARDAILVCPPTFGMYAVGAAMQDAAVVRVPLVGERFALDIDAVLAAITPAVKIVFVCSPNNPTGALVPLATIDRLVSELAGRALVVVDEAYIEFADGAPSAAIVLHRHDNLGVLRTLSKAWALAGARVGALLAHPQVIGLVRRIMAPYPLPSPCVDAALQALDADGKLLMRRRVASLVAERERLRRFLRELPGVRGVLPSRANFLTVRFDAADAVLARLAEAGIVVRDVRRHSGLHDALRVSVGSPQENRRLCSALRAGAETQGDAIGRPFDAHLAPRAVDSCDPPAVPEAGA